MFMGNDEIKNTLSLTKLKINSSKTYMRRVFAIVICIYFIAILPELIQTLKYKDLVIDIKLIDYSFLLFLGLIVFTICACVNYRRTSNYYAIFPQTNMSRFLSAQLTIYLWLIYLSVVSLLLYLIQYLIFKVLSLLNDNIVLGFKFDFGFVMIGFFAYLLYGLLVISLISLIAVLIRRFNTLAVVSLLVLFAFFINNDLSLVENITHQLRFLMKEEKLAVFFLKGSISWLLLFSASILINKYSYYYKTSKKYKNLLVAAVGFVVLLTVSIVRTALMPEEPVHSYQTFNHNPYLTWQEQTLTLDVSKYEDLSKIHVSSNIDSMTDDMVMEHNLSVLSYLPGDKIDIYYRYPINITNGYDLSKAMNPDLSVSLKDNILDITYIYDKNKKVIFVSPWSLMKQFDYYKNKDLYFDLPLLYSSNSRGNGSVRIEIK